MAFWRRLWPESWNRIDTGCPDVGAVVGDIEDMVVPVGGVAVEDRAGDMDMYK